MGLGSCRRPTPRHQNHLASLPIFVAGDSADAWAAPHLFELDPQTGRPVAVAGVPPDYFSEDGQLWGNPLYRWKVHAADGYRWWMSAAFEAAFALYDIVRIDHFRGFDAYWRIPSPAKTARLGQWTPGPGLALFEAIQRRFPAAPITRGRSRRADGFRATTAARYLGLPGMLVLQFAFGGDAANPYLPHLHTRERHDLSRHARQQRHHARLVSRARCKNPRSC